MMEENRARYFIVSSGRCGSSFLAAILADAGADFGMPTPSDWTQDSGALEHEDINYVSRQFRRAEYLLPRKRISLVAKYLIDIRRSLGKKRARDVLRHIRYAKSDNLDLWIWHVTKMGYRPHLIISYRAFDKTARSFHVLRGTGLPHFAEGYCRTYENALLMLDVYGGCAISFEELVNLNETSWADALSRTTGIAATTLIECRNARLKPPSDTRTGKCPRVPLRSQEATDIEERLRQLKGQFFPASSQIVRKWEK